MKKVGIWNNYTCFSHNELFNPVAYQIGDDLGYPFIQLRDEFYKNGYLLETIDCSPISDYDAVIFLDVPNEDTLCCRLEDIPKIKRHLILTECEMIYKKNSNPNLLKSYHKVYTYNDKLVEKCDYIKLCLPNKMREPVELRSFNEKKFCTMIAGNKKSIKKGELYSKRLKWIKYMQKMHPNEFDLYGMGWDKYVLPFELAKFSKVLNFFGKNNNYLPSYKGKIINKIDTINKYKFCISYENTNSIPGYISEKIWDVFFAGSVPVYLGAPNIEKYIPANCYIDVRNFENEDDLYKYLVSISEEEYHLYLNNIKHFILSSGSYPFSAEYFSEKIIREVLG